MGSDLAGRAVLVTELAQADSLTKIQDISGDTGELINTCWAYTQEIAGMEDKTGMLQTMIKVGKSLVTTTKEWTLQINSHVERGAEASTRIGP